MRSCSSAARYAASTKGQPTFLNLDKPYPNPVFTVLIWGENRSKFGTPESEYKGKRVCVTGKIREVLFCDRSLDLDGPTRLEAR